MAISYSIRHSFSRFFLVMVDDLGWSRAAASGIYSANVVVYGLSAPIVGTLADRLGTRRIVPVGAAILGLGALIASRGSALWQFYLLWMLMALGACLTGYVPHSVVLSNWFVRKRGAAMGMFQAMAALAFFSPFLTQLMIAVWSWRVAYIIWGVAVAGIIIPLAIIFHKRHPRDVGQEIDGLRPEAPSRAGPAPADSTIVDVQWVTTEWTLGRALRNRRFWALFFASFFLWGIGLTVLLVHQIALIVDAGYGKVFATLIFALYGAMSTVGNLGGLLSDRIGREITVTLGIFLMVIGVSMLLFVSDSRHPWLLYLFAVAFGLGVGINTSTFAPTAADLFQGKNFGSINGVVTAGFGVGGAMGSYLGGLIYDIAGDYRVALATVMVCLVLAASLIWMAAPRKVRLVAGQARRLSLARASQVSLGHEPRR